MNNYCTRCEPRTCYCLPAWEDRVIRNEVPLRSTTFTIEVTSEEVSFTIHTDSPVSVLEELRMNEGTVVTVTRDAL